MPEDEVRKAIAVFYDGDENDISFRIPASVGLVQTYYYDNQYYA